MKNESLIHIKFEYEEALRSKRDILYSEMNLLKISKSIKNYSSFRLKELGIKLKLHRKIKEINSLIRKLQIIFPKVEIPEILRRENEIVEKSKVELEKKEGESYNQDLEYQLQEIHEKLNNMQR